MDIKSKFQRAYNHYESFVKAAIKNSEHLEIYLRDTTKLDDAEKEAIRVWLAKRNSQAMITKTTMLMLPVMTMKTMLPMMLVGTSQSTKK